MNFGLSDEALARITSTSAREPRVDRVTLYGSLAKGCFKDGSDIDLSLEGPGLDHQALLALETEIDDLLLPWKVDLSLLQHLDNPEQVEHIRQVGKLFHERP
jgi:predicted nucleotidyltransferase